MDYGIAERDGLPATALSLVKVALASSVPVLLHKQARMSTGVICTLVVLDAS